MKQPPVRSNGCKENPLPIWEKLAAEDLLNARAVEQRVIVACRRDRTQTRRVEYRSVRVPAGPFELRD